MPAKHLVRLKAATRTALEQHCSSGQHAARLLLHVYILLLTGAEPIGPAWSDEQVVDALGCSRVTVERRRWYREGLEAALRVRQVVPWRPPKLTGKVLSAHYLDNTWLSFWSFEPVLEDTAALLASNGLLPIFSMGWLLSL